jgi:hypothetical protein
MSVQADSFSGEDLRKKLVIFYGEGGNGAAGTGGEQAAAGFPGIAVVGGKEGLKDNVGEWVQGEALADIFPGPAADFGGEEG